MASSATRLEDMIEMLGDAALTPEEREQVTKHQRTIEDSRPLAEKYRKDKSSLSPKERAQFAAASNADLRVREIRTKAFKRALGIEE